ncbi:hypothetical protein G6F40_014285 [Rhizopus arrhizus]|nr:hypothetical protein G6F40_014285 [Rhizopus arrhizus]
MATSRSWLALPSRCARCASLNTTKANSPPSHNTLPSNSDCRELSLAIRPITYSRPNLPPSRMPTPAAISHGSAAMRSRSMPMPTAMKNRPSSSPLNGSICASSSCRNSESDNSTPARKAPRLGLRPASCMNQAVPSTTNRAVAVNTSGLRVRAMMLNTLRSTGRPHRITTASAPSATAASSQRSVSFLTPPSSGMAASNGIAIRSWNSRMAKPSRPWSLLIALRSDSSCRPTAVDDSASATPTTSALFHWK